MAATRQVIDNKLLGWERFFHELGRFLESSGRNYPTASEPYAEFILERLELCIILLNAVKLHLQELRSGNASGNGTDRKTLQCYHDDIEEVLGICRALSVRWKQKIDEINATGNHVTVVQPQLLRSSRGRPRFDMRGEQLLYLSSMSFSWTDIARMLGVSRMTVYR